MNYKLFFYNLTLSTIYSHPFIFLSFTLLSYLIDVLYNITHNL